MQIPFQTNYYEIMIGYKITFKDILFLDGFLILSAIVVKFIIFVY